MNDLKLRLTEIDFLLSPAAIRERAGRIFALTKGGGTAFEFHDEKMQPTVDYVLKVIRQNYPDLKIPFHSRWGHFRAGKIDRAAELNGRIADKRERARAQLDLVITSVLLDAGAGERWRYHEDGVDYTRSEGLGVASFHLFMAGALSGDAKALRADANGLRRLTEAELKKHFQVDAANPLVGVPGRLALLNGLAGACEDRRRFTDARPGNILDFLASEYGDQIPATGILRAVLDGFGSIWPGRLQSGTRNLGDVWLHPGLGELGSFASLVPIHKLSQWMTYSLIEPIEEAGHKVTGVSELTGLAEYRNGGLFLDSGLISLREPKDAARSWAPGSQLIVEWRALTVHLLDQIGEQVRRKLGKTAEEFPLARVLEGGTWWAGRFLAQEKRKGGPPPLNIESDGTVF